MAPALCTALTDCSLTWLAATSGRLALKYDQLEAMDCLVATLSVDPVKSHNDWLQDVVAHCENKIEVRNQSVL